MPKDTREKVTLSPEAYKALQVEAMLHNSSLKDTASKLILKAACPKCKEILDIMAHEPNGTITQEHEGEKAKGPNGTMSQESKVISAEETNVTMAQRPKGPKAKLYNDPLALTKLKELYNRNPRPSLVSMGKELGYSKSTIADNIRKLRVKGELE